MTASRSNRQMFALPGPPPQRLVIAGSDYRLSRVFKHDFWAATTLYEPACGAAGRAIVVKFGREQYFANIPLQWVGKFLADHEESIYHALAGLAGVPRWIERLSPTSYAIEYVDGPPLDHLAPEEIPAGFFDRLRTLFDEIHSRDVAYVDGNKRSNILVTADGPVLIDFQISLRLPDWPGPLHALARRVIRYFQEKDIYHLYKHKRRLRPDELTPAEHDLSRRRSGIHGLHRKLTKPYRSLRRSILQRSHQAGTLQSPTAELEDHHQPEKQTWRN